MGKKGWSECGGGGGGGVCVGFPCAVCCRTGVDGGSVFCGGYRCQVCGGGGGGGGCAQGAWLLVRAVQTACPLGGSPLGGIWVGPGRLGVVASFCCLGDMFSAVGGCGLSATARVGAALKGFGGLLPVLSSCRLSFRARGRVCEPPASAAK